MEKRYINPIPDSEILLDAARFMRDLPPAHYTFKIESFSALLDILSRKGEEKYESGYFEVGGYKWRLSLYPDGDKKRKGIGHISLYLALAEPNTLPLGSAVNVFFKLFVYDQIRDKYLTQQDRGDKITRLHAMKTECGFSKFLPLSSFNDATNGYLIDDCCVFGAEVFVANCTGKGEIFSVLKEPQKNCFTWKIDKFSGLQGNFIKSEVFKVGGYSWELLLYPNGDVTSKEKSLSVFLIIQKDCSALASGQKLYVEFTLQAKDQVSGKNFVVSAKAWYSSLTPSWGYPAFLPLSDLKDKSKGFMVKDTLIVEVQITLLSVVKNFS